MQTKVLDISNRIVREQSPSVLKEIREPTYELITKCVLPQIILSLLLNNIVYKRSLNESTKREMINWFSFYDKRIFLGDKPYIHLEALYSRIMLLIYKDKALATRK